MYWTNSQLGELGMGFKSQLPLRNIYLNAVGIGEAGCKAIAAYLVLPECPIESLYLSNNPIGDAGAMALAKGLKANQSLLRLSLKSCCMKTEGGKAILEALQKHPRLMSLNMSQSFATEDLRTRHNFFEDGLTNHLRAFIANGP